MKIDVSGLLAEEVGTTQTHLLNNEAILVDEDTSAQVSGEVTLTKLEESVLASIAAQAHVTTSCDRCLSPAQRQLDLNIQEEYYTSPQSDPDKLPVIDHTIDLTPSLAGEISVNLPVSVICTDQCRGLCPACGTNRNTNTCDCPPPPQLSNKIDIPWQPNPRKR